MPNPTAISRVLPQPDCISSADVPAFCWPLDCPLPIANFAAEKAIAKLTMASPIDLARFHAGDSSFCCPERSPGLDPTTASATRHRPRAASPDGGNPEHERAAGLLGEGAERAGLVGVAAGTERETQDDERHEQVQDSAGCEADPRRVLERLAIGCLVDRTVD